MLRGAGDSLYWTEPAKHRFVKIQQGQEYKGTVTFDASPLGPYKFAFFVNTVYFSDLQGGLYRAEMTSPKVRNVTGLIGRDRSRSFHHVEVDGDYVYAMSKEDLVRIRRTTDAPEPETLVKRGEAPLSRDTSLSRMWIDTSAIYIVTLDGTVWRVAK